MKYTFLYTEHAKKDLLSLDTAISRRIVKKLDFFLQSPDPLKHAKPLTGVLQGLFRFRVGDYRIIFQQTKNREITILLVLTIKHRRNVYEKKV